MANVTISELTDALKRAGLPVDDYQSMKKSLPFAKYSIKKSVYGSDTKTPQLNEEGKAKIAKLSEVDQRLAGVYGEKGSSLYIENPMARENIYSGAEQIGYKTVQSVIDKIKQRRKELESESGDSLTFFRDLMAINKPDGGTDSGDIDFESLLSGYNGDSESSGFDKLLEEYGANS